LHKILVTTVPFAAIDSTPLKLLKEANLEVTINPIGRKLKEEELAEMIVDYDGLIAGTEPITDKVLKAASRLKHISRVGIGLDSVDLLSAKAKSIKVSYTPDGPSFAVAELTLGLILNLIRQIHVSNDQIKRGVWHRHFGKRIEDTKIGLIGIGRVGSLVAKHIRAVSKETIILANDIALDEAKVADYALIPADRETIYRECDVISLHLPLTRGTRDIVKTRELECMKQDVCLINTSRGGIINEEDLARFLINTPTAQAAIDVFNQEPYVGPFSELNNILLTAHMGSMSIDCRSRMELEATEESIRFFSNQPLILEVPQHEYDIQSEISGISTGFKS
jgi:D-3-phosphoglycerate dehydrogenase